VCCEISANSCQARERANLENARAAGRDDRSAGLTRSGTLVSLQVIKAPSRRLFMSDESDRQPIIVFRKVHYQLANGHVLLKDLDLSIDRGEILVLLGRSGAGKTTALKLINRLLDPNRGEVRIDGRTTREWDPIELRRHIGYVIQETGLFPHYTVEQNVSLIPRLERWPASRVEERVRELLGLVDLDPGTYLRRYPHELSGGQRQRVGVARALAADPSILLMDEPFGALDPVTRTEIRSAFKALQHRLHKTVVIVTHDIGDALLLGSRIALLEAGELVGIYTKNEFLRSQDPFAAAYVAQLRLLGESERSES
jgi:osmoprotectant transport system ATP-binding protein